MTIKSILLSTPRQILTMAEKLNGTAYKDSDNYVYVDRGAPITLVAHVDTLPRKEGFKLSYSSNGNVITAKGGGILGADDRAGCYALFTLSDCHCNLLFTNHEEIGGLGAYKAAEDLEDFMITNKVRLLIEFDRKGCNEYVTYNYALPEEIRDYVQSFGYIENNGSYSDIAEFNYIPAVNVSCGYYLQHTNKERLHVDELMMSINRVKHMLENPPDKLYDLAYSREEVNDMEEYDYDLDSFDYITGRYTI